jgi:galactokinase/galacturonokinase
VALIDPAFETQILEKVEREYLQSFPEMRGRYSAHICHSADGVKL